MLNSIVRDFPDVRRMIQRLNARSEPYTPAWTSTGTAPALGNGTIRGRYVSYLGWCFVTLELTAGSTTTFGTGSWRFELPFALRAYGRAECIDALGVAAYYDAGATYYPGTCQTDLSASPGNLMRCWSHTAPGGGGAVSFVAVGATAPITWATSDILKASLFYPIDT